MVADRGADLVLLVGDVGLDPPWFAPFRQMMRERHDESVREVIDRVQTAFDCPLVFVPGNHDLPEPPPTLKGTNADRRTVEVEGLTIAGFGGAGPAQFGFPYEWTEAEAESALRELDHVTDIALFHAPPSDTGLDRPHGGEHAGSTAVRSWIERVRPRLFLCGHIHEAWGVERLGDVPCINAGALGEPHGQPIIWAVHWQDGPTGVESLRFGTSGGVDCRSGNPPSIESSGKTKRDLAPSSPPAPTRTATPGQTA